MGTDETQPDVQPVAPAPAAPEAPQEPAPAAPEPQAAPPASVAPAPGTEPQDAPDPTPPAESGGPTETAAQAASPVFVDSKSARDDNDALEGHFCQIVSGPHQGRRGVFDSVATYDPQSGYPTRIVVRSRDAQNELLSVDYAAVRPAVDYSGGR